MPTIALTQPKGGVGKTTSAIVLATELAKSTTVILIDADGNQPLKEWAKLHPLPENMRLVTDVNQDNVQDQIEAAQAEATFVIVDCAGMASITMALAINMADLAIIPTQGSQLDAVEAMKALALIKRLGKTSIRETPHAILLTRVPTAATSRTAANIYDQLRGSGGVVLKTPLYERQAFRDLISYGGGLDNLEGKAPNLEKAKQNARDVTYEIIGLLRQLREQREVA